MSDDPRIAALAVEILGHVAEGYQVVSPDYRYVYLNDAAVRHARSSRDELIGRAMVEAFPGIDDTPMFAVLRRCMTQRVPARTEHELTYPDGRTAWFELRFQPVSAGLLIRSTDLTELRRAEGDLGGVAHELNNLLSVILSYAEFARDDCGSAPQLRADVDEILGAATRAVALSDELHAWRPPAPRSRDTREIP